MFILVVVRVINPNWSLDHYATRYWNQFGIIDESIFSAIIMPRFGFKNESVIKLFVFLDETQKEVLQKWVSQHLLYFDE